MDLAKYRFRETGALDIGPYLVDELVAMEDIVADKTDKLLAAAPASGVVNLQACVDQAVFEAAHPDERTPRALVPYPFSLQHPAVDAPQLN